MSYQQHSLETLARIHARAFPVHPWSAPEIEALSRSGGFLLCSENGFCLGRIATEEAELLTIAVDPAAQGRGEGARLLQEFSRGAAERGASVAFLEVAESNHPAIHLYLKTGWQQVARRPRYYRIAGGKREDAIVMRHTPTANAALI